jgi:hypothetical protein
VTRRVIAQRREAPLRAGAEAAVWRRREERRGSTTTGLAPTVPDYANDTRDGDW